MDKYERVRTISKIGRFGHVYSFRNKLTNQYGVAKEFNRRGLEAAQRECGFLDELAGSEHIVCKIEEIPNSGERLAMTVVYEALAATTLRRFLDEEPNVPLPLRTIKTITRQILQGLADAHALGIVHRDLRPSKVFDRVITLISWICELAQRGRVLFPGMNLVDSSRTLVGPRDQDTETQYLGQLYKIFSVRGTPRLDTIPDDVAPFLDWQSVPRFRRPNWLRLFPNLGVSGNRLLALLLSYSPRGRPTARAALEHEFFRQPTLPV